MSEHYDSANLNRLFDELNDLFGLTIRQDATLEEEGQKEAARMLEVLKGNGFAEYINHVHTFPFGKNHVLLTLSPEGMNRKLEYEVGLMQEGEPGCKVLDGYYVYVSRICIDGDDSDTLCMWNQ